MMYSLDEITSVKAEKIVDLPTFGKPTIPHSKAIYIPQ